MCITTEAELAVLNLVPREKTLAEKLLESATVLRIYATECVRSGREASHSDAAVVAARAALTPQPWCPSSLEAGD